MFQVSDPYMTTLQTKVLTNLFFTSSFNSPVSSFLIYQKHSVPFLF